jgi:hypothetical protein
LALCRKVRVFRFATGKLSRAYDESLAAANELQRSESGALRALRSRCGRPSTRMRPADVAALPWPVLRSV